ncbi:hypothetical protein PV341_29450 [Streptomyces sp. PA03-1a]|nr:hypothetical protein [Streptomyces sp. PA03-1a]
MKGEAPDHVRGFALLQAPCADPRPSIPLRLPFGTGRYPRDRREPGATPTGPPLLEHAALAQAFDGWMAALPATAAARTCSGTVIAHAVDATTQPLTCGNASSCAPW